MTQQAFVTDDLAESDATGQREEFRTARFEALLPPSLKEDARKIAASYGAGLNELVVRCLEAGLSNENVLKQLAEAQEARRRRRELNRLKQSREANKAA